MPHSEFIREIPYSHTAILFIHGILGTPRHFDDLIPLVPREWSVYNILLDGHGGEVDGLSDTSMHKWQQQISKIIKMLSRRYDNIIITAHSMGSLFAAQQSLIYPQIKLLCLLAVPLAISVKPAAAINSAKIIFDIVRPEDEHAIQSKKRYGIYPDKRLWKYIGWLPRYIELFELSAKSRKIFSRLTVPCYIFQSGQDELVSMRSMRYLRHCPSVKIKILPNSGHAWYGTKDHTTMLEYFHKLMNAAHRRFL